MYGPPETLAQPDAVLLAQAIKDVQQAWPELQGHRIGQHLQRNPETHTLPAVGPKDLALADTAEPWPMTNFEPCAPLYSRAEAVADAEVAEQPGE